MDKDNFVKQLRELASFIEEKDFDFKDVSIPYHTFHLFCSNPESFGENAKALGSFEKSADSYLNATKRVTQNFSLQVTIGRELVCKKVVTGKKIIPATEEKVIPEQIIPASPEKEEDVYEYVCPESFVELAHAKL